MPALDPKLRALLAYAIKLTDAAQRPVQINFADRT